MHQGHATLKSSATGRGELAYMLGFESLCPARAERNMEEMMKIYRFDLFHYEVWFWDTVQQNPIICITKLRYSLN